MSDVVGPNQGPEEVGPEYLDASSGAPLPESAKSGKRLGVVAGAAIVGVGLVSAGAWAATAFFANGAQPAEALPATTLAYVSVDLEPSGEQQVEAYRFLKKFPAFSDVVDLDEDGDPREQIFEWIQDEGACEDLSYADDVEPWVGSSAALAAVDTGGESPSPVAIVEISDADAADAGLKKLQECSDSDDAGAWVINGDWAIFGEDVGVAEDVVAATEDGTLVDSAAHSKWLDEVGDLGVMTMYVGPDALDEALKLDEALEDPAMSEMMDSYRDMYEDFGGMAGTLRFDGAGLEFVVASDADFGEMAEPGDDAGESVASLPDDTVAALGVSLGDEYAETLVNQLATLGGVGEDVDQMITELEQQTGLQLPEDLQTLLGDSMVAAVGGDIDMDTLANSADGSDIPVGVKITGDASGIEDVLAKVRAAIGPGMETILESEASGDDVAIGPSADYRGQLLADGDLGGSETFSDVVGDPEGASAVFFLDFDAADNWLDSAVADTGDQDAIDNFEPLSALGLFAEVDDDVARVTLRVSTD